ncbi:N-acetyltransferase family protein [Candidatus Uabimicrobium sp. HlEnr_7]|uniref:GNAT family N-acetyltransferase n=1 Tax=Candidatus Uabimicrobium helgolandensis TaxID=3095367 RepID=UPI0035576C2F
MYQIRKVDRNDNNAVDLITRRCMETVLETIPEFQGDPQIARRTFSNFTFEEMRNMLVTSLTKPEHEILVAIKEDVQQIVAHSIFSIKKDNKNISYGFCYSRYVNPDHRQQGLGSRLLKEQENWWVQRNAKYAVAQTHTTNIKLKKLFEKHGFIASKPQQGTFSHIVLTKRFMT